MMEYFNEIIEKGGEGLILRNPLADYEEKRSSNMLKVKPIDVNEAEVIGHQEGEGKYVGMLGSLIVRWDGHLFNIGSGLTDEDRVRFPKIGDIISFKHQGVTDAGVPRFPIYLATRDYE